MYQVAFSRTASKSLKKFPIVDQARIKRVYQKLGQDPFALDIKKLRSPNPTNYRIRVGSHRIFLNVNTTSKDVLIVDIERRTTQTYH